MTAKQKKVIELYPSAKKLSRGIRKLRAWLEVYHPDRENRVSEELWADKVDTYTVMVKLLRSWGGHELEAMKYQEGDILEPYEDIFKYLYPEKIIYVDKG